MKAVLILVSIIAAIGMSYASADTIDFAKCFTSQNHHCYSFNPQLNKAGGTNEHVAIHLPDNNAVIIEGIFSADNYSRLQSNPFVGAVEDIYTTTASPTLHYCLDAKYILEHQGVPEYTDLFYNLQKTPIVNNTHLVYPDYCYVEAGPNPIDGSGITTVPEFGQVMVIVLAISVMSMIIITAKREIK